jgi:hypothetical protein
VLFEESIHFQSFSIIMMSILVALSVVGVILGIYLGNRYWRSDVDSPWEPDDKAE